MRYIFSTFVIVCLCIAFSYGIETASAKQAISAESDGQCRLYNEKSNNYKYEDSEYSRYDCP